MIPKNWRENTGKGVKVAILDSVWKPEPDVFPVALRCLVNQPTPDESHAAKVAQVIASLNPRCLGVAPACDLYVAEVIGNLHRGWGSLREALKWAETSGCQVINMSFACPNSEQGVEEVMHRLDRKGVILVASFNAHMHWPHSLTPVISVGLLNQAGDMDLQVDGDATVFSKGVVSSFRGTSAASARVAGAAACSKESDPSINRAGFLELFSRSRR